MTKPGQGVPERLIEFFRANPKEELTLDDIALKFGCTRRTAENAIASARTVAGLERVSVYRVREAA